MPLFGPPNIAQLEAKRDTQGLVKALQYKDPVIRIAAADALAPLRDPIAVEPLVGLLHDENPGVRRAAVSAVYRRLMTDPDQDARRATAVALGKVQDRNAVEPLIKAINDADEGVRLAVIRALQAIADVRAALPLVLVQAAEQRRQRTSGRTSPAIERAAAGGLDAMMGPAAIPGLAQGLTHNDEDVREIVVKRLTRIGGPEVAEPLAGALKDADAGIRRAAASGLSDIGWHPGDPETAAVYYAALREWRKCAESGAPAVPCLVDAYETADPRARAEIVAGLVGLGWEPEGSSALAGAVWAARGDWDKVVAMGADGVAALTAASREAPRWRDRLAAARNLEQLGQTADHPFPRSDIAAEALAIFDEPAESETAQEDKKAAMADFAAGRGLFKPEDGELLELCECGYPLSRVDSAGERTPLSALLGYEVKDGTNAFFCPACDAPRAS